MNFSYYSIYPCVIVMGHEVHSFRDMGIWCDDREDYICTRESSEAQATEFARTTIGASPVYWTLYGHDADTGIDEIIGTFKTFEASYAVMNGILAPMADARDKIEESNASREAACDLEDVINQSSTEDRL